jgi:hypothetical protein
MWHIFYNSGTYFLFMTVWRVHLHLQSTFRTHVQCVCVSCAILFKTDKQLSPVRNAVCLHLILILLVAFSFVSSVLWNCQCFSNCDSSRKFQIFDIYILLTESISFISAFTNSPPVNHGFAPHIHFTCFVSLTPIIPCCLVTRLFVSFLPFAQVL